MQKLNFIHLIKYLSLRKTQFVVREVRVWARDRRSNFYRRRDASDEASFPSRLLRLLLRSIVPVATIYSIYCQATFLPSVPFSFDDLKLLVSYCQLLRKILLIPETFVELKRIFIQQSSK